jgi:hypothetical protein
LSHAIHGALAFGRRGVVAASDEEESTDESRKAHKGS